MRYGSNEVENIRKSEYWCVLGALDQLLYLGYVVHKERYQIKEIEEKVWFVEGEDRHEVEVDESEPRSADLSEALAALRDGCWDNIDERDEEVICYPADREMNFRTGAYESTTVVVYGEPNHIEWLMALYHAKASAHRTKFG